MPILESTVALQTEFISWKCLRCSRQNNIVVAELEKIPAELICRDCSSTMEIMSWEYELNKVFCTTKE